MVQEAETRRAQKERLLIEQFFRRNIRDIPGLTEKWFNLLRPVGETGSIALTEDGKRFIRELAIDARKMAQVKPLEAVNFVMQRAKIATNELPESDLRGVFISAYYTRASIQDSMVHGGQLRRLPSGNYLRSLNRLSAAADFMRSDIVRRYATERCAILIAECFDEAEMSPLQRVVMEMTPGHIPGELGTRPKYSRPQSLEMQMRQREINAQVQYFL